MNTQHTPGPWSSEHFANGRCEIQAGIDRSPLAEVYGDDADSSCWPITANAQLIAAAPEMLSALQLLVNSVHEGGCGERPCGISGSELIVGNGVIVAARAAITKATGGAQ